MLLNRPLTKTAQQVTQKANKSLWQAVTTNPQLRDLNMWIVWMTPSVLVPLFRFLEDRERPFKDRFKLSVRDGAAYMGGTFLNFTFAPVSYVLLERRFGVGNKAKMLSTFIGSVVSASYSGLLANKFAGWFNKKVFHHGSKPKSDLSGNTLLSKAQPHTLPHQFAALSRQPNPFQPKPVQSVPLGASPLALSRRVIRPASSIYAPRI